MTAVRHFVLTIPTPAAPVCLKTVYANQDQEDRCLAQVHLQLLSGTKVFVGGDNATVTSTNYAWALTTSTQPVVIGSNGPVKLSDLYATGTAGDKLAIGILDV